MYLVENVNSKERFVMVRGEDIVRIFSNVDNTGNSDFTISLEEFERDYKILEKLED